MPYKRKKPFFQKYQTALINLLTILVFATLVLTAIMLTPRAIEHLQGHDVTVVNEEEKR